MARTFICVMVVLATTSAFVYAKAPDFAGRYAGDGIVVELHSNGKGYEGVMRDKEESIPLQCQVQGGRVVGTFTYQGDTIVFKAAMNGSKLSFTVGETTIVLTRQTGAKAQATSASQTAATAVASGPQPGTAADVTRFRRISVQDGQVIGGEAVSFLVPVEWRFEGGIVWRRHPAIPAGPQIRVFDPNSLQQVEAFPSFPYTWGDNCGPGKLMPIGARWFGNEVHPPFRSAQECLETSIIPCVRGSFRWRVSGREKLSQLAAAHQQNSPHEPGGKVFFDAARVRIHTTSTAYPSRKTFLP